MVYSMADVLKLCTVKPGFFMELSNTFVGNIQPNLQSEAIIFPFGEKCSLVFQNF